MEVSSISADNNSGTPPTTTTLLPPSNATSINTSQLLFSNDNLQSQAQKSPTNLISNNDNNLKAPQSGSSDLFNHKDLVCNDYPTDNNCNSSSLTKHCYESNEQEMKIEIEATKAPPTAPLIETTPKKTVEEPQDKIKRGVAEVLETLLSNLESEHDSVVTLTTIQSTLSCCADEPITKVALITPLLDEEDVSATKDIVTLRNLEITPPPQPVKETLFDETPTTTATTTPDIQETNLSKSVRKRKLGRTHSDTTEPSEGESSAGRSKRQRKQTELFQVVPAEALSSKKPKQSVNDKPSPSGKKSVGSSKKTQSRIPRLQGNKGSKSEPKQASALKPERLSNESQRDFQDVICYEKNDYLAIRNEENTFFLCQLTENVRVQRPFVKIRWLDTSDNGKTYFITSHYDKIPQKSIIMPVMLNKLEPGGGKGKPVFSIDEPIRETVMERLKRSLNIPTENFD